MCEKVNYKGEVSELLEGDENIQYFDCGGSGGGYMTV